MFVVETPTSKGGVLTGPFATRKEAEDYLTKWGYKKHESGQWRMSYRGGRFDPDYIVASIRQFRSPNSRD